MTDFKQQWADFITKTSHHFKVTANQEFLLFMIGIQEMGFGVKAYSKQEKTDLITLARCRLLEITNFVKQTGIDDEGWPKFEVLKDENDLLPSERDKMLKQSMMDYYNTNLFN